METHTKQDYTMNIAQSTVAEQLGSSLENMENEQRSAVTKQRTMNAPSPSKSLK